MSITSFLFKTAVLPDRKIKFQKSRSLTDCVYNQAKTLLSLLGHAQNTRFGRDHGFSSIRSVGEYQARVPVRTYENFFDEYFKPASQESAIKRNISYDSVQNPPYLNNITWPGLIRFFSLSSGTTSGKTKFIPLTKELMASNHEATINLLALHYLKYPESGLLDGKSFVLGGNLELRKDWNGNVEIGDLSGAATREAPFFMKHLYFPGAEIGRIPDWEIKIKKAAEESLRTNITLAGGVPSWMLLFFEKLNEIKPFKGNIRSVWPKFEVLVHGGISFDPYRKQFEEWLGKDIHFQEVYPASEAFIAIQDPEYNALRLQMNHGIFYEFIPVDQLSSQNPKRLTIRDIEIEENYAILLTTCGGLWSYLIGDTIRFISKEPLLLKVTGRTKYSLSAFGEHLIQEEIEKALDETCKILGVGLVDYHVAPHFPDENSKIGWHDYVIEFLNPPEDLRNFMRVYDRILQEINEDYAAHRSQSFGMGEPNMISLPQGFFQEWMKRKGKLGGQHKVPRISSDRSVLEDILFCLRRRERTFSGTI